MPSLSHLATYKYDTKASATDHRVSTQRLELYTDYRAHIAGQFFAEAIFSDSLYL